MSSVHLEKNTTKNNLKTFLSSNVFYSYKGKTTIRYFIVHKLKTMKKKDGKLKLTEYSNKFYESKPFEEVMDVKRKVDLTQYTTEDDLERIVINKLEHEINKIFDDVDEKCFVSVSMFLDRVINIKSPCHKAIYFDIVTGLLGVTDYHRWLKQQHVGFRNFFGME